MFMNAVSWSHNVLAQVHMKGESRPPEVILIVSPHCEGDHHHENAALISRLYRKGDIVLSEIPPHSNMHSELYPYLIRSIPESGWDSQSHYNRIVKVAKQLKRREAIAEIKKISNEDFVPRQDHLISALKRSKEKHRKIFLVAGGDHLVNSKSNPHQQEVTKLYRALQAMGRSAIIISPKEGNILAA